MVMASSCHLSWWCWTAVICPSGGEQLSFILVMVSSCYLSWWCWAAVICPCVGEQLSFILVMLSSCHLSCGGWAAVFYVGVGEPFVVYPGNASSCQYPGNTVLSICNVLVSWWWWAAIIYLDDGEQLSFIRVMVDSCHLSLWLCCTVYNMPHGG